MKLDDGVTTGSIASVSGDVEYRKAGVDSIVGSESLSLIGGP